MAAGAGDVRLQLGVTLDLPSFRAQLGQLAQAAAAYRYPINIDKKNLDRQLQNIDRQFARRNYRLEVITNFAAEIENANKLINKIQQVKQAAQGAATGGGGAPSVGLINTTPLKLTAGQKTREGARGVSKDEIKALYESLAIAGLEGFERGTKKTREQMIVQIGTVGRDTIAGLLNGLKSGDAALKEAAKNLGNTLITTFKDLLGIASPSKVFRQIGQNVGEGFQQGAIASMDRAFDALERQLQERLRKLQGLMQPSASRRGAFPFVAKTGPIESSAMITESVNLAKQIDQARSQIAQIQARRESRMAFERESLQQSAGRLLPAGPPSIPAAGTQERVVRGFYESMRNTRDFFNRNFVAGTYLPKATKELASSMNEASKLLTGTKTAGLLPSFEMMESLRFQRAALKARMIDEANAREARRVDRGVVPAGGFPSEGMMGPSRSVDRSFSNYITAQYTSMMQAGALGRGFAFPNAPMMGPSSPLPARATSGPFSAASVMQVSGPSTTGSSAYFPTSGMMGPSSPLGTITAKSSMFGGGGGVPPGGPPFGPMGGGFGGGGFMRAMADVKLPGSGVIRELGTEFAFATKQVLLFGQAYKLLAFLQNFPAEVGAAVGQLQSFRNTLDNIAPSAQEAAKSNQFILDTIDRYNIPLQSARDGFVKLYASMAPAGFSGEEIRGLFTGISQAAATFGMSADKVDRVNYAFAQMASKGQVMSEELKGQLGDVLPGAMAIFAEAAGFKGPEAITKFSKALEDGAYKGDAMRQLLLNVGIVMRKEFGPGAEGAARTFQGVINRMQNSMKLLYESFEPVAVGFLNTVVMPLTNGIKTITDGFNAFFTGTQAKTAGGAAFAQQLKALKPAFDGIAANIKTILPLFSQFGQIALGVGQALIQIAGNPVVGYLTRVYAIVLPLTIAFNAIKSVIGGVIATVMSMNGAILLGTQRLTVFRAIMQITGLTARQTAIGLRVAAAALVTLGGTGVLLAIGALIEKMFALKGAVDSISQAAIAMRANISGMANAGMVGDLKNISKDLNNQLNTYKSLKGLTGGGFAGAPKRLPSEKEAQKLQEVGLGGFVGKDVTGRSYIKDFVNASKVIDARIGQIQANIQDVQKKLPLAQKIAQNIAQQTKPPTDISAIPAPTGGDSKGGKKVGADKAAKDAERLREQIAQQAQAASDALFAEQQRLLVLQQTNPIAESIAKYTSQEAIIQRELNMALKEAKSDKEKTDLKQAASIKSAANVLELEKSIKDVREQALKPIEDLIANQREQLAYQADYQQLLANGINPEIAKQVADVRKIVRDQLAVFDTSIKNAKTAIAEAEARGASADQVARLRKELQGLEDDRKKAEDKGKEAEAGIPKAEGPKTPSSYIQDAATAAREELVKLANWGYQVAEGGKAIGSAFAQAFKDIVSGSVSAQEALANMMQSIASHFFDMAAQIIAQQITMVILGTILKALGVMGGGGFSYGGPNYSSSFNTTPGTSFGGALQMPKLAANGAVWEGGFTPFANGGIVNGPTLGLVGEGRYNEAIVPLPNGRSIPVQLQGDSLRDKMSGNYGSSPSPTILSMNFETTSINGVEYVSREQLEAAMMETRRAAVKEGSAKGASLAIDKLQQSPNTRRRVGMR